MITFERGAPLPVSGTFLFYSSPAHNALERTSAALTAAVDKKLKERELVCKLINCRRWSLERGQHEKKAFT